MCCVTDLTRPRRSLWLILSLYKWEGGGGESRKKSEARTSSGPASSARAGSVYVGATPIGGLFRTWPGKKNWRSQRCRRVERERQIMEVPLPFDCLSTFKWFLRLPVEKDEPHQDGKKSITLLFFYRKKRKIKKRWRSCAILLEKVLCGSDCVQQDTTVLFSNSVKTLLKAKEFTKEDQ